MIQGKGEDKGIDSQKSESYFSKKEGALIIGGNLLFVFAGFLVWYFLIKG